MRGFDDAVGLKVGDHAVECVALHGRVGVVVAASFEGVEDGAVEVAAGTEHRFGGVDSASACSSCLVRVGGSGTPMVRAALRICVT